MQIKLTAEEQFRLHGRVEGEVAVELLNSFAKVEALDGLEDTLKEAKSCLPQEDVLSSHLTELRKLLAKVRGQNKETLEEIIEELNGLREELVSNADHGADLIRQAIGQVR